MSDFINLVGAVTIINTSELSNVQNDLVWINSFKCYFHKVNNVWERIVSTTSKDWLSKSVWYIDPVNGNDENVGDVNFPLLTFDEINKRLSIGSLKQNTEVIILDGYIKNLNINVNIGEFDLKISGITSTILTDSIKTYSDRNHSTAKGTQITANGISDWTNYKAFRLKITSGASIGAMAWVAKENPDGYGKQIARTTRFATNNNNICSAASPSPGDSFILEDFETVIYTVSIKTKGTGNVLISAFSIGLVLAYTRCSVYVDGCIFDVFDNLNAPSGFSNNYFYNVSRSYSTKTQFAFGEGCCVFEFCYVLFNLRSNKTVFIKNSLFENASAGTSAAVVTGQSVLSNVNLIDVQFFNCGACIYLSTGSKYRTWDGMSGSGNTTGLQSSSTSAALGNISFSWRTAADLPNLLATSQIVIFGSTNITLTWAQMPFYNGEQRGTATLVNGSVTVASLHSSTRGVLLSLQEHIGTGFGTLYAYTANRSATSFIITSRDAAGNILTTDQSKVNWLIPGFSRKIIFFQEDSLV